LLGETRSPPATILAPTGRLAHRVVLCDPAAVHRAAILVILALLTFNVSGLAALCGDPACEDDGCPGDMSGGQCAPNCHYCSCCSLPRVAGSDTVALAAPQVRPASWASSTDELSAPEPADILHVPIPLLA
jgi:hypothetical protein